MLRPDAIRWPKNQDVSTVCSDDEPQLRGLAKFADEHLQAGPQELAHVHSALLHWFASRNPTDTMLHHRDSELRGQPRYRWEPQGNDLEYGYLIDGPKTD